tara:strand:- start:1825 stop:2067 length:243 start_codon:yes stop_codon:yes gene_type:complete
MHTPKGSTPQLDDPTQVINPKKKSLDHISLGTRRPLGTSGFGHVLLSAIPDDDICRLFHRSTRFVVLKYLPSISGNFWIR